MQSALRVGTSGWSYAGWRQGFYAGVPQRRWLAHCAEHFTGVEVNATFYRRLKESTFAKWREETPEGFAFAIKGSRFVTHVHRLAEAGESIAIQRGDAAPLGPKLSAVLWQLPKSLRKDVARLDSFGRALGAWPEVGHAVEFRDETWFDEEVAECLSRHGLGNCQSDAADWPFWDAVTADLVYVRLHGHERTYASAYEDAALRDWAKRIRRWLSQGRTVHVYFDNDAEGAAPYDAMRLLDLLDARPASASDRKRKAATS